MAATGSKLKLNRFQTHQNLRPYQTPHPSQFTLISCPPPFTRKIHHHLPADKAMAKRIATLKAYIQHHAMNSFELFIAALIVLSVLLFAVETLPNKGPLLMQMLAWADSVFLVVFSTEYLLRIWLAHKKTDYIFSFYGVVDLICILPFYFAILMGLESLRLLRLFRLLRIFKMVRYSHAINRV